MDTARTAAQDVKDVERDCIELNGTLLLCSKLGYAATVDTIAAEVEKAVSSATSLALGAEAAREISRKVLQCANRTTSGGDAFEVLDAVACPRGAAMGGAEQQGGEEPFGVMACAVNEAARPISLRIDTGVFRCTLRGVETGDEGASVGGGSGGGGSGVGRASGGVSGSGNNGDGTGGSNVDWLEYGLRVVARCDTRYALSSTAAAAAAAGGAGSGIPSFTAAALRYERHFAMPCAALAELCGRGGDGEAAAGGGGGGGQAEAMLAATAVAADATIAQRVAHGLRCSAGKVVVEFVAE